MHDTALATGRAFFEAYGLSSGAVLDVGSMDVNGTLRPLVPAGMTYVGCDLSPGPNVDVVLTNPHRLPFDDGSFDLVVSTSCLEHDELFWLTFTEMARVVVVGGYVYLSVPTGGNVHRHPVDCWRFYPDAGQALARWSSKVGYELALVESFVRPPGGEGWSDFVAVFGKSAPRPPSLVSDHFSDVLHRSLG